MKDENNEMTQERYHEYMLRMLREIDEKDSLQENEVQIRIKNDENLSIMPNI